MRDESSIELFFRDGTSMLLENPDQCYFGEGFFHVENEDQVLMVAQDTIATIKIVGVESSEEELSEPSFVSIATH